MWPSSVSDRIHADQLHGARLRAERAHPQRRFDGRVVIRFCLERCTPHHVETIIFQKVSFERCTPHHAGSSPTGTIAAVAAGEAWTLCSEVRIQQLDPVVHAEPERQEGVGRAGRALGNLHPARVAIQLPGLREQHLAPREREAGNLVIRPANAPGYHPD